MRRRVHPPVVVVAAPPRSPNNGGLNPQATAERGVRRSTLWCVSRRRATQIIGASSHRRADLKGSVIRRMRRGDQPHAAGCASLRTRPTRAGAGTGSVCSQDAELSAATGSASISRDPMMIWKTPNRVNATFKDASEGRETGKPEGRG